MAMDTRMILAGRGPDVMGSFGRGLEVGQFGNQVRQENALRALYAAQGPQIMQGQPNALAALARLSPEAGLGIQGALLDQTQARQDMAFSAEEMQMRRAQAKAQAEALLAQNQAALDAAKAEEYQRDMMGILAGGAAAHDAGPEAFTAWSQQNGVEVPFNMFPAWAAQTAGEIDALDAWVKVAPKRAEPPAVPAGMRELELRAQAAGLIPDTPEYQQFMLNGGAQKSATAFSVAPDGTVTYTQGAGIAGAGPTAGAAIRADMTAPSNVLSLIEEIKNDPSLPRVVGPLEGGGGNNVDDLGAMARAWYGEGGLGVIQKIAQLQGNAWLAAREMLKGGGQITDYESRKAEGAVARLSRAQGEPQFRAALTDLEDAIREGMKKLEAAQATGTTSPAPAAAGSGSQPGAEVPLSQERMDELLRKYGGP